MPQPKWYDNSRTYSNWSPELDQYMQALYSQYGNTSWWTEFSSNPYLKWAYGDKLSNYGLNKNFYDDMRDTYQVAAYKHINEILQKIREQGYNEPSNQVALDRAAGLNSDLLGVTGNQATEGTELPAPEIPSLVGAGAQSASIASTIASSGLAVLQSAVSFVGGFQDITGKQLTNRALAIGNEKTYDEVIMDRIANGMNLANIDLSLPENEIQEAFENEFINSAKKLSDWSGIPRVIRKDYSRVFARYGRDGYYGENADGTKYFRPYKSLGVSERVSKLYKSFMDNRKGVVSQQGDPLFSKSDEEFIRNYAEQIGELSLAVQQAELNLRGSLATDEFLTHERNIQIQEGLSDDFISQETSRLESQSKAATDIAKAQSAQAGTTMTKEQLAKMQQDAIKEITKAFDPMIKMIKESNSIFAPLALLGMFALRAKAISQMQEMLLKSNVEILGDITTAAGGLL